MNLQENITKIKLMMGILTEEFSPSDFEYSPKTLKVIEKMLTTLELPKVKKTKVVWDEKDGVYLIKLYYGENYNEFRSLMIDNERRVDRFIEPFLNLPPYSVNVVSYVFREEEPQNKEEESEGVGVYAAPAFEMKPDHIHFKHLYNEDDDFESNDENYSPQTIKIIEKVVGRMDLPMVEDMKVLWNEEQGIYRVQLYYSEEVSKRIKRENELKILGTVKPFLGLPSYTFMTASYTIPTKYKD